ncbi:MAG: putative integral membrane protein (TIGR00698 family) [Candidatus Poriferisodalaceae bacterium]|jgi:uncharacterized integral membrane protein (TIGR00698 family)
MALASSTADIAPPAALPPVWPGLLAACAVTGVASVANAVVPQISTLIVAVVIGMAFGNWSRHVDVLRPGLAIAAKRLLRVGVVLLGLRLSVSQVTELGTITLLLVMTTVTATFFGTQWLGQRLGLSRGLSLLVATGYSICGASAIAAMEGSADADDEEVALSIGLVTLAGTVAMFALPMLAGLLGLSEDQFGTWVGASVHDVAQVVAAASTGGATVLSVAVVVKLTRVVLLAPLVAGVNVARARRTRPKVERSQIGKRPPVMPMFVVGFLALMAARSTGLVPVTAIDGAAELSSLALTAALVGLGAGVRFGRLRRLGATPLLLGVGAWIIVAAVSLGLVAGLV